MLWRGVCGGYDVTFDEHVIANPLDGGCGKHPCLIGRFDSRAAKRGRRADACENFRRNKRLHVVYNAGLEGACGERGAAFDEYAVDAAFSKGGHKLPQIDASVMLGNAHDFAACLLEL